MYEKLYLAVHGGAYLPYLFKTEFPFKDDAAAAGLGITPRAPGIPYGALGGCMQGHGDIVPSADTYVPDYECVHTGGLGVEHEAVHLGKFLVAEQDVHGYENPRSEFVGVVAKQGDVFQTVAGCLAGSERRPGYIYGIGTAVYSSDADFRIPGRSQKFEFSHYLRLFRSSCACTPNLGSVTAFW